MIGTCNPSAIPARTRLFDRMLRSARALRAVAALALLFALSPQAAHAQEETGNGDTTVSTPAAPSKIAIGVPRVAALEAVVKKVAGYGQANELAQVVEGLDAKLEDALNATRKFDVRAHTELARLLKEQGVQDSGNYDLGDPQRAKPFKLAGIPYLAVVQIDDFQDQVQKASFEGVGAQGTRRQIRLSAVCRIFDTTTGNLKESKRLTLSDFDFKNNPTYIVDQKGGDLTEAVINVIADRMATACAQSISDILFPAKVLVVRDGVATINRGEGAGISVGEVWEAFATGEELIDPDTGESLGAEEVAIGFVRVISVAPKFARAEVCGLDRGIAKGCIVRKTDRKDCGSSTGAKMVAPAVVLPEELLEQLPAPQDSETAPPLPGGNRKPTDGPAVPPIPAEDVTSAANEVGPFAAAIFIRNREKRIDDAKVSVLEDFLVAGLDEACFTTMSREDTINAVSKFAKSGPNAGRNLDPEQDLDKILSDNTSALSLAQSMGADYVLVASITTLSIDRRKLNDPARGVMTDVERYRLDVTYRILGRSEGKVIASGSASASDAIRQTQELSVERDVVNDLLRESAGKMAEAMKARCKRKPLPKPEALELVELQIIGTPSDLAVPDIVKDEKGNWTVTSGSYRLEPTSFVVEIDGVVVGTTPSPINAVKGLRKLRVTRPDYEPFSATINVQPGNGPMVIPMKITAAGMARIREMSDFFQALKKDQQLTEAQVKVLEGYAEQLRNSKISIDQKTDVKVDTNQAPVFQERSFWPPYLRGN